MRSWTEFHIAIVYFAGLLIALATAVLVLWCLLPLKSTIKKIVEKSESLWSGSFKTTIILAGLFGAMSVTFRDCDGNYDYLLSSKKATITKGLEQVSSSFDYLTIVLGIWLLLFLILRLAGNKARISGTNQKNEAN